MYIHTSASHPFPPPRSSESPHGTSASSPHTLLVPAPTRTLPLHHPTVEPLRPSGSRPFIHSVAVEMDLRCIVRVYDERHIHNSTAFKKLIREDLTTSEKMIAVETKLLTSSLLLTRIRTQNSYSCIRRQHVIFYVNQSICSIEDRDSVVRERTIGILLAHNDI